MVTSSRANTKSAFGKTIHVIPATTDKRRAEELCREMLIREMSDTAQCIGLVMAAVIAILCLWIYMAHMSTPPIISCIDNHTKLKITTQSTYLAVWFIYLCYAVYIFLRVVNFAAHPSWFATLVTAILGFVGLGVIVGRHIVVGKIKNLHHYKKLDITRPNRDIDEEYSEVSVHTIMRINVISELMLFPLTMFCMCAFHSLILVYYNV